MEIVTRAQAKALKSNTYYTGLSCKNGHISYRYTNSGACADCVNGSRRVTSPGEVEEKRAARARAQELSDALMHWAEIKVPAKPRDIATVQAMAQAFAFPHLGDVPLSYLWISGPINGLFYKVRCHPSDVETFHRETQKLHTLTENFNPGIFVDRLKQFDPPARPFPTVDDIAK